MSPGGSANGHGRNNQPALSKDDRDDFQPRPTVERERPVTGGIKAVARMSRALSALKTLEKGSDIVSADRDINMAFLA